MNIRRVFNEISNQLLAEFRKSAEVKHSGGKGIIREDALKAFLRAYLPKRYAVGQGEVISSNNDISGQLDIIIYDPYHCPALIISSSHAVYPIESVYGVISVKSSLSSAELEDAYRNIASVKRLVPAYPVRVKMPPGEWLHIPPPVIFGAVLAYRADRSLDAIATQVTELDSALDDLRRRPDFIAVLDDGIVGPLKPLRSEGNKFGFPKYQRGLVGVRRTKRHTLLRVYLQMLNELNSIHLHQLSLESYLDMPEIVGNHRVKRHDRFVKYDVDGKIQGNDVKKLNANAIRKILDYCTQKGSVTIREHLLNTYGFIKDEKTARYLTGHGLDDLVFEFNPNNKPPIDVSKMMPGIKPSERPPAFVPIYILIDSQLYALELSALSEEDYELNTDIDLDELFSA